MSSRDGRIQVDIARDKVCQRWLAIIGMEVCQWRLVTIGVGVLLLRQSIGDEVVCRGGWRQIGGIHTSFSYDGAIMRYSSVNNNIQYEDDRW